MAIDRTKISGVTVEARETAKMPSPNGGNPVPLTGVDYVLLVDGTEMYQCARDDCAAAFTSAVSARSHLTKHSAKRQLARIEKARARQGNGVKSIETKAARTAAVTGEAGIEFLNGLADQLEAAVPLLRYMAKARTEPTLPEGEVAELRRKAEKWDQAQSLFGGWR